MTVTRRRHEGAAKSSDRPRPGALWAALLALPLVACGGDQATPKPEKAAGGRASRVHDSELKDPFTATPGAVKGAKARTPSAELKDPFKDADGKTRAGLAAPAAGPSAELKDPFKDAPPPPSRDGTETTTAGLKDPFRAEPAGARSPRDAGLKDPFQDEPTGAAPDDDAAKLKDPFRAP
jgi:hypothetical protein